MVHKLRHSFLQSHTSNFSPSPGTTGLGATASLTLLLLILVKPNEPLLSQPTNEHTTWYSESNWISIWEATYLYCICITMLYSIVLRRRRLFPRIMSTQKPVSRLFSSPLSAVSPLRSEWMLFSSFSPSNNASLLLSGLQPALFPTHLLHECDSLYDLCIRFHTL